MQSTNNVEPSYTAYQMASQPVSQPEIRRINKKSKRRQYTIIALVIIALIIVILFEVYRSDFERWAQPLTNWLTARKDWSWVIPVVILIILSVPPLFGHEIVQLIVGLAFPLGVAIGIAVAGAILGEAFCFILFKYCFTGYVDRKIEQKVKWAAVSRVAQEAGFKGILVIRYSIIPPHLANPLFACTGMKFWLYMITVILSLPKSIVFVALGSPSSRNSEGAKAGKVIAVGVLVVITVAASFWIRKRMAIATKEIERERGIIPEDGTEESIALRKQTPPENGHRFQDQGTNDRHSAEMAA